MTCTVIFEGLIFQSRIKPIYEYTVCYLNKIKKMDVNPQYKKMQDSILVEFKVNKKQRKE